MKIQVIFLMLLFWTAAYSQNKIVEVEDAVITCQYHERMSKDTVAHTYSIDTVILKAGKTSSAFYSRHQFFSDSLLSLPDGQRKFMQMMTGEVMKYGGRPRSMLVNVDEYVYQNYPDGYTTTVSQSFSAKIVEKRELPVWTLLDSCKTIDGYTCYLAETDFRGRVWRAWYTPEIPINSGPWKLWGLPGLILETYDKNMDYVYTLISLVQSASQKVAFYNMGKKDYAKMDRIKYLRKKADMMCLEIGSTVSHYYSHNADICDSIAYKGHLSKAERLPYPRTWLKANQKAIPDDIYWNYPTVGMLTNEFRIFTTEYLCSEPLPEQKWDIQEGSHHIMLGYMCVVAKTIFRGREYTAYFTTDIPLHYGPWKFHGLPGLILKVEESSGKFKWEAVGIEKRRSKIYVYDGELMKNISSIFSMRSKTISREQAFKLRNKLWSDPLGLLQQHGQKFSQPLTEEKREAARSPYVPPLELE